MPTFRPSCETAPSPGAVFACLLLSLGACQAQQVEGEGQFSRPIPIASDPAAPLPRLAYLPGDACPGPEGGCPSFCTDGPGSCPDTACLPLLIDSGSPLSVLPGAGELSFASECVELRAAGGLLDDPAANLDASTAAFRLLGAPVLRAPSDDSDQVWSWEVGDEQSSATVGGIIGGNVLRDFALELRHLEGETPSVAFFSEFPGSEGTLADQGRAYLRLQFPGRLLGRLLDDRCELGNGLECDVTGVNLDQNTQRLLFESSRALLDACVAPPPCTVQDASCGLTAGGSSTDCSGELGGNATLVVATGVPGVVLFNDSATTLFGPLEALPACADGLDPEVQACVESDAASLTLPGWAPLEGLTRLRVRSLGLVQGLDQSSGSPPCQRLRARLLGLRKQCEAYEAVGIPTRPETDSDESVGTSVLVVGEVSYAEDAIGPSIDAWLPTLVIPETAPMVLALRREIVPEGAQPDGLVGSALLRNTSTVLDYTEPVESPGIRVRCLDPGRECMALPACTAESGVITGELDGTTSCCYGLPSSLIATRVLDGAEKEAPRIEDACCPALPRAALADLQSEQLGLCTGYDPP